MPLYEGIGLTSDKHSVVIEIGQAFTRCGFVHEYSPRAITKSQVYSSKQNELINLFDIEETHLLPALKEFIQVLYFRYLAVNPKDRRVIIVESLFCPSYFRNELIKTLFLHLDIPALLLVPQHLVSLATLGITSALVLDVGYKEAVAVPIIEGVTILDALQYAPLGGKAIHFRIMDELIRRRAILIDKTSENVISEQLDESILEDIKFRTCFVASFEKGIELAEEKVESESPKKSDKSKESKVPCDVSYPIKGDKVLVIPGSLRESVCEVMFEMYGEEQTIPTLLMDALIKCTIDTRKQLASNIVLIGGSVMLPGFKHRLMKELNMLAESERYQPKIHFKEFKFHELPCKENYASWLGASIFGSTEVLSIRSISREQYLKSNRTIQDWNDWIPGRT